MSNYATYLDLSDRLGAAQYARVTDRVTALTPDDSIGAALIVQAESVVDGELGKRYSTPVTDATAVAILLQRTLDIAVYMAWRDNGLVRGPNRKETKAYDDSIKWLAMIGDGQANLPGAAAIAASPSSGKATTIGRLQTYTPDSLDGL